MRKLTSASTHRLLATAAALALASCNDHSIIKFSVGGSISGLSKAGLVLQNNARDHSTIPANAASFRFRAALGSHYDITVATQPTGLTCTVSNGVGRVNSNINNIHITCTVVTFTVGGAITGLTGSGLVLQNNGGDDSTIAANATTFEFSTRVVYGSGYAVTILTQPTGQSCSLANASGTATTPISDVALTCTNVQFSRFEGHHLIISDERLARDPSTAAPLYFVFVDNTSSVNPDGSHEHPYPTLALAEANSEPTQIIYVFPGDGTAAGMDAGITLQAGQKLWGAGTLHAIETSDGSVSIPAASSSRPQMTNAAGTIVTLATDNEVSGIIFHDTVGHSIFGDNPGSAKISSNTFEANISISEAPLLITATAAPLSLIFDHNTITNNETGAIALVLSDAESVISITNNTITDNRSGALGSLFGSAIVIDPNNTTSGTCDLLLSDNIISGNEARALAGVDGAFDDFRVTASNNTIANNGGGFSFSNPANRFTLTATDNVISQNADHGILTVGTLTTAHVTLTHNQITGQTNTSGGVALAHDGTDLDLTMTDNDISGNQGSGLLLFAPNAIAHVTFSIQNNTLSNNQNLGLNAAGGIDLEQYTNLSGVLDDNTLSNNASPGVLVSSINPSPSVCLEMSGNDSDTGYTLSNNGGTFDLAPPNAAAVNTGTINTIGTISAVQSCP